MLKHKILLADGRVLTSGPDTDNAIRSVTLTEQVSDEDDLCPGAACAACAEIELWAPENGLRIAQGEELTLLRLDTAAGTETQVGIFLAEKPTKDSANVYSITAYDRMTLFDRDMSHWLEETPFPLTMADFLKRLCEACGVEPAAETLDGLPQGDYLIRPFDGGSVTGRQLLQWAAQANGRFARMTAEGQLELAWYSRMEGMPAIAAPGEAAVPVGLRLSDGILRTAEEAVWRVSQQAGYYLQGSLQYEDYQTAPVDKVQLKQSDGDVGVIWPPAETGTNALVIRGNLLLTTDSAAALEPVARTVFASVEGMGYTPLRLTMPFVPEIRPGTALDVVDAYGQVRRTLVMKRWISGQTMELESTGNARRDTTTAVNTRSYRDLQGKVLEMQTTVDGLELSAQQDFPGNRLASAVWRRGSSSEGAGGTVTLNGQQVTLQGDGTGSCGAVMDLPEQDLPVLAGAALQVRLRYRITREIQVAGAGNQAYITLFAMHEDGSYQSSTLAILASEGSAGAVCDWTELERRMELDSRAVTRLYLFVNIRQGTGTLEADSPSLEIDGVRNTRLSLTAAGVQLSSAVIDLTGTVSFTDLAGEGKTTINGANITTGTIDAGRVNVTNLNADNIKSGTLASQNGALTIDLNSAALVAGNGASLRAGSDQDYTRFQWNGFNSYTGGALRSGMENNWSWFNRSMTAIFSTSGLTGIGYKNAAGSLQVGYTYDPYSDIQSGHVNYLSGAVYGSDTINARIQRCRYQMYLENGVAGQNDAQIQAYDNAVRIYGQGFYVNGNIGCSGAKNRIVATGHYGNRALNAMESPAAIFCDNGSGILDEEGLCLLVIHPVLEECLDPHALPQWLVTGAGPGFWVEKQGRNALVHGPAGTAFDWLVLAPQQGYSDCYADAVPDSGGVPDAAGETELDFVAARTARRTQELDALTDAVAAEWARLEEMEETV